jgi:hypothetical protein
VIEPVWLWPQRTMRLRGAKRCPAADLGLPDHDVGHW